MGICNLKDTIYTLNAGEGVVFALDGERVIGYEGKEYTVKAGDTFKFDKNGKHSVTAVKQFKMALLLVLG